MPLFRKRKDSKSDRSPQDSGKTSPISGSHTRKPSVPYRHIPTRAAHDARELRLPRLSLDTKNIEMHAELRAIQSAPAPTPAGVRFFSAKDRSLARDQISPKDKSSPLSPMGRLPHREKPTTRERGSTINTPTTPQDRKTSMPYRHVPTHAATDAFRTSAGTQAGWHRTRINTLEDHSRRLSMALAKPGIRRFGSSSSSSSSSVASIDSILCDTCSSAGKKLNRKCSQQHLVPKRSNSSIKQAPASSVNVIAAPVPSGHDENNTRPNRSSESWQAETTSSGKDSLDSISEDEAAIIKMANVTTFHKIQFSMG